MAALGREGLSVIHFVTSQDEPLCLLPRWGDGETPPFSHILFSINCFQVGPEVALQRKVAAGKNLAGGSVRSKTGSGWEQAMENPRPGKGGRHLVCIRLRASKPKA